MPGQGDTSGRPPSHFGELRTQRRTQRVVERRSHLRMSGGPPCVALTTGRSGGVFKSRVVNRHRAARHFPSWSEGCREGLPGVRDLISTVRCRSRETPRLTLSTVSMRVTDRAVGNGQLSRRCQGPEGHTIFQDQHAGSAPESGTLSWLGEHRGDRHSADLRSSKYRAQAQRQTQFP